MLSNRLVTTFAESRGAHATNGDLAGLEEILGSICAKGRAAYPEFDLTEESFVAHLARCGASVDDTLRPLHVEDLYLACACLAGNTAAVTRLHGLGRPVLARYLSRIGDARFIFEEVEQRLWNSLLVGESGGPKLASYSGRGPLGSWIGVSAQRIALMELRHERAETRARQELSASNRLATDDPEMAAIKQLYREQFQSAVGAAIASLDDREKTLYRLHLVDGLTLEAIGKVYGVHHTTILRRLTGARERVLEFAKMCLRAELPVSTGEFDSIARLLLSEVDLNISQVLGKPQ